MIRWLDTIPPLDRELGAYLLLGSLIVYALVRLFQDARDRQGERGREWGGGDCSGRSGPWLIL